MFRVFEAFSVLTYRVFLTITMSPSRIFVDVMAMLPRHYQHYGRSGPVDPTSHR